MKLSDRIKAAREYAKLTQEELAKRVGISQTAIHKLECGQSRSSRRTVAIALTCGVNPVWLETGRGPKVLNPEVWEQETGLPSMVSDNGSGYNYPRKVPLISWRDAGTGEYQEAETHIPTTRKVSPNSFALMVYGDAMQNEFVEGDILVIDPEMEPRHNNFVVVRQPGSMEATFKQLVIDGGRRYLKPLNERYPITEMSDDAQLCGVVVSKQKQY